MSQYTRAIREARRGRAGTRLRVEIPARDLPTHTLTKRQKQQVRKMIQKSGSPNYFISTVTSGTDIIQAGDINDCTAIIQGDGQGERVQDRIQPTSLQVRGSVTFYGTGVPDASNIPAVVRMMVVRWKPDTANDDLDAISGNLTEGSDPWDAFFMYDEVSRKKFNVLKDLRFLLCSDHSTDAQHPIVKMIDFTVPLKGHPVQFNEGLTTGSNKVYLVTTSSNNTANNVEAKLYCKLNYRDLE